MKKRVANVWLFVLLGLGNLFTIIVALFTKGAIFRKILFAIWAGGDQFGDFFGPIAWNYQYSCQYENYDAIYPPLHAMIYHFFSRILRGGVNGNGQRELIDSPYGAVAFVMVIAVCVLLLSFSIFLYRNDGSVAKGYLLCILLLFTYPFMGYAIKTGNSVFLTVDLMLLALALKNSDNRMFRELALLLIAIAASLKITPAILGILYLSEKRWKEAGRLIMYGIFFFFVPFLFEGGMNALVMLLSNLAYHNEIMNAPGTIPYYINLLMVQLGLARYSNIAGTIGMFSWIILVLFFIIRNGRSWSSYLLFFSIFIVASRVHQAYNLIYITVPLLEWMNYIDNCGSDKVDLIDFVVPCLFIGVFFVWNWNIEYLFVWGLLIIALFIETNKCLGKRKCIKVARI